MKGIPFSPKSDKSPSILNPFLTEAFPAVTVPCSLKTGDNCPTFSSVVL